MKAEELEEVPCPACNGRGVFVVRDDMGKIEDWKICYRCNGAKTIIVVIKRPYVEEE